MGLDLPTRICRVGCVPSFPTQGAWPPEGKVNSNLWIVRRGIFLVFLAGLCALGCLHEGLGTEPNLSEAIVWWRRSAGQDYPPAQISIGDAYLFGKGLEQDEEEGVRWYRKAADQGYAAAQHRLGNCYFNGQGVRKDVVQAIQWYRKAADQGYKPSIKALRKLEQ
ncbi:MAG: sel1 repeat family protein [Verrucomicrobia bacterium]|nr:sel1 repeat family protein [Verrucomicrobiota bacterium]